MQKINQGPRRTQEGISLYLAFYLLLLLFIYLQYYLLLLVYYFMISCFGVMMMMFIVLLYQIKNKNNQKIKLYVILE